MDTTAARNPAEPPLLVRQADLAGERDVASLLASAGFTADCGTNGADGRSRLVLLL